MRARQAICIYVTKGKTNKDLKSCWQTFVHLYQMFIVCTVYISCTCTVVSGPVYSLMINKNQRDFKMNKIMLMFLLYYLSDFCVKS